MSDRSRWRFAAAALVVVLLAAACGSSSKSSSSKDTSGSSGSTKAATGSPIKIGVVCTCSGTFGAAFKAGQSAFEAWAATINASGGLQGHPIELSKEDDAGDPGQGTSAAKGLIDKGVVALVDLSLVSAGWKQLVKDANVPTLAGPTAAPSPQTFWVGQTLGAPSSTEANVRVAKASGATKLGDLYCAESPACVEGAANLEKAAAKVGGVTVAYKASFASNAPNYTSQCLAAKNAGVDAMIIGSQPSTISKVAADCDKQGFRPVYQIGVIQWSPSMLTAPGLKDGTYGAAGNYPFFDQTQPEIKRMTDAINKFDPRVLAADNKDTPGQLLVSMWAGGLLLEKAVPKMGITADKPVTREMILNGIYALDGETLNGLAPPLKYTRGQNQIIDCWFTAHFKEGKYFVDNGGKSTCGG